ncbi:N-formylglutamate amidohydrolase [Tenacibaculum discolor]|nr:N-formylglutamate amidohydrolase [Tenacibaculum discolor]MDP2541551.1 N-formylglutamate amidohydrolase [Tenacibaculum discolor]
MILHIPHSSIKFPNKDGFVIYKEELSQEVLRLTDWYTDELFESKKWESVKADFSRIFCDTERFSDNSKEVMFKYGMGVLYEKSDDGNPIRIVTEELRENILTNYYWKHHSDLNKAVLRELKEFGESLIIDCHSFPDTPLKRDLDQSLNRPDFNIGTDSFHTPKKLIDASIDFFKSKDFSLGVDKPYSGSIVPIDFYEKDKRVGSIMLEVNRKLYLQGSTNIKSDNFQKIKELIKEYLEIINSVFYNDN